MKFVATKKCLTKIFFHPSLFYLFLDPGSGIRDPGSGIRDGLNSGSGIRDKHPGSATLVVGYLELAYVLRPTLRIVEVCQEQLLLPLLLYHIQ